MFWNEPTMDRNGKRGAFTATDKSIIVADVAFGMEHAHQHGIMHRDLKPANILLGENCKATASQLMFLPLVLFYANFLVGNVFLEIRTLTKFLKMWGIENVLLLIHRFQNL